MLVLSTKKTFISEQNAFLKRQIGSSDIRAKTDIKVST